VRDLIISNSTQFEGYVGVKSIEHGESCFTVDYSHSGSFEIQLHTIKYRFGLLPKDFDRKRLTVFMENEGFGILFC
jgi:hypothetical protein